MHSVFFYISLFMYSYSKIQIEYHAQITEVALVWDLNQSAYGCGVYALNHCLLVHC